MFHEQSHGQLNNNRDCRFFSCKCRCQGAQTQGLCRSDRGRDPAAAQGTPSRPRALAPMSSQRFTKPEAHPGRHQRLDTSDATPARCAQRLPQRSDPFVGTRNRGLTRRHQDQRIMRVRDDDPIIFPSVGFQPHQSALLYQGYLLGHLHGRFRAMNECDGQIASVLCACLAELECPQQA